MKVTNSFKSRLQAYFKQRLGAYDYRHGWLKVPVCPYCGREKKLGINLSLYRTNCFRCNANPSPAQLIMDIEHFSTYHELMDFLSKGDFDDGTPFKDIKYELPEAKPIVLPEGYCNIEVGESLVGKVARAYLKRRGFDITEMARRGVGYITTGDLLGYIIIPFYTNGELSYYNARLYMGNGPRYKNPDKDITGLGKSFLIYNYDALDMYKTVYICEGAFNALTIGDNGIAMMGKSISRYQINQLLKASCERFVILLDPDAKDEAIDLALQLVHYKLVKVVFLPEGRDVNDLGRAKTLLHVQRTRYQNIRDLMILKHQL